MRTWFSIVVILVAGPPMRDIVLQQAKVPQQQDLFLGFVDASFRYYLCMGVCFRTVDTPEGKIG